MSSYTIGQVAERSGFSATALRYYEDIGLVTPAGRTAAGYRVYDDRALARLSFIARAKQLGCPLDEITELVEVWNGDRCGPVQARLHELVTTRAGDAERQIAELGVFTAQLRSAASQLGGAAVDGPCSDACACLHHPAPAGVGMAAETLGRRPSEAPIACTLDLGAMSERLDAWAAVLAHTRRRVAWPSGAVRLELDDEVDIGELARLVAAEQHCCSFFRFAITVDSRGVGLDVGAPEAAADLVAALFGGGD